MKILIFIDKLSSNPTKDEEDTVIVANDIKKLLIKKNHEAVIREFDLNLKKNNKIIKEEKPSLIVNLVETLRGSSTLHLAPLMFEKMNIKYTGGTSTALFLTGDKVVAKKFLKLIKVNTPKYYDAKSDKVNKALINRKVIIKERDEEASIAINDESVKTFANKNEIISFIKNRPNLFVEEYIEGREFNVSVISINKKIIVLPIAEMTFIDFPDNKPKILNYKSKWDETSFEYQNTKRSFEIDENDIPLYKKMETISRKCFKALGSKGYLRVDFRVDSNNIPYVLEINVNPCINKDSGFSASAKMKEITYKKLISAIINEAINE